MKTKLVPLFENSYFEIKKHSSIVQMSNIATLQERKVMNALIWIAKDNLKRSPNDRVFTTDLWILKRLTGLKKNDNIELKEALRHLATMAIEYNILQKDDTNEWGIFRFISEVKIKEEWVWKSTNISFEFPTSILETIKMPNMFVTLDLMIMRWLESKHSIVLYEFIKDYFKLGKIRCTISDFRKLMGVQDNQYKNFAMLRKRALDIAVYEINEKTDITLSYTLEKYWKNISAILFSMQQKKETIEKDSIETDIRTKLKLYGVSDPIIETLVQKHDLDYLSANLKIVEEQIKKGGISNITWYLLKAFKIDYRIEETPFEIEEKKKKALRKIELEKQNNEVKQNDELKKEKRRIKDEKAKAYIETISEEEKKQLWDEFISEKSKNIIFARLLDKFGAENSVIESERLKYVSETI